MNARTLAKLCQESYHHETFTINECEVMIKYYDHYQVVVFRGTEDGALFSGAGILDMIRNLRIIPWYDKDTGWVHAGFLKGAQKVCEELANYLPMDKPVICTGHSLGGALALMTAGKLQKMGFNIKSWIGFGSPKCQLTKKQYDFLQVNYRYCADIVPMMPRLPFYRHNYMVINLLPDPDRSSTWDDHDIHLYVKALSS